MPQCQFPCSYFSNHQNWNHNPWRQKRQSPPKFEKKYHSLHYKNPWNHPVRYRQYSSLRSVMEDNFQWCLPLCSLYMWMSATVQSVYVDVCHCPVCICGCLPMCSLYMWMTFSPNYNFGLNFGTWEKDGKKTAYLMDSYVLLTRENTWVCDMCASLCTYSHTTFISRSDGKSCLKHFDTDGKVINKRIQSNSVCWCWLD